MIPASDIPHVETCGCASCHPLQPALWSVFAGLYEIDPAEALLAMRSDGDETLFDDPFIEIELQIAALLASNYGVKSLQAKRVLEEALQDPLNPREVDEALAEASRLLGDAFDEDLELEIRRLVNRAIIRGALVGEGVDERILDEVEPDLPLRPSPPLSEEPLDDGPSSLMIGAAVIAGISALAADAAIGKATSLENMATTASVHEGIVRAARYYTNNHFNRIILPEIQRRVALVLNGASSVDGFGDINLYLSRRLRNVPYWRIVANSAASRAYHYGMMRAAALRQFRGYQIVAVLDERTSDICRAMDGTVFPLHQTVDLLEQAASAEDPEEAIRLLPWVPDARAVEGRTADELRDQGYVVPPFHPNCRSTIKFV